MWEAWWSYVRVILKCFCHFRDTKDRLAILPWYSVRNFASLKFYFLYVVPKMKNGCTMSSDLLGGFFHSHIPNPPFYNACSINWPISVVEAEPPDVSNYRGGIPPGGVKVRCSLDLADEFTCAWPSLLLRHEDKNRNGKEDDGDGNIEKWRVAVGFGGLVLSKVASGEGAAADSSPFIRCYKRCLWGCVEVL